MVGIFVQGLETNHKKVAKAIAQNYNSTIWLDSALKQATNLFQKLNRLVMMHYGSDLFLTDLA